MKRHGADRYVLISLVAFAFTVLTMRAILRLSGYPEIGSRGTVHVAHLIFGGLGLFGAMLLMLVLSNRWALTFGAVISGGGVGLFIDEVGKLVTASDNYFTRAAAPIIYGLFLATMLVYLRLRRPPERDQRGELYRAFEQLTVVLDHSATMHDLAEFERRLLLLRAPDGHEATRALAAAMADFVAAEGARATREANSRRRRTRHFVDSVKRQVFTDGLRRNLAALLLVGCGLYEALRVSLPLLASSRATPVSTEFLAGMVLQGIVGLLAFAAAALIAFRRYRFGLGLAVAVLIGGFTVISLLVFYHEQVLGLVPALLQCAALAAVLSFRYGCLPSRSPAAAEHP